MLFSFVHFSFNNDLEQISYWLIHWCNKLIKTVNGILYLYSYLEFPSQTNYSLTSPSASVIKPTLSRTQFFENTFFWYCINQWNILQLELRSLNQLVLSKTKMIKCRKKENSVFPIHDPLGVKLFIRLRVQFSHLNKHKFRHGFGDTICAHAEVNLKLLNTFCLYSPQRLELFQNLEKVGLSFLNVNVKDKVSY